MVSLHICTLCVVCLFVDTYVLLTYSICHGSLCICCICGDSRQRIKTAVEKLPVNFMVKACVEARVSARGPGAWEAYRAAENDARAEIRPCGERHSANGGAHVHRPSLMTQLRPAWNWFKWTAIIITEFGAFLVSLKEVLEAAPSRTRRYQRIV